MFFFTFVINTLALIFFHRNYLIAMTISIMTYLLPILTLLAIPYARRCWWRSVDGSQSRKGSCVVGSGDVQRDQDKNGEFYNRGDTSSAICNENN